MKTAFAEKMLVVRTIPRDHDPMQYITNHACSLNRIKPFLVLIPRSRAKGSKRYSITATRSPVNTTRQKTTNGRSSVPQPYKPVSAW